MSEGRLLVVEDDPMMQRLLTSQLTVRGFSVAAIDNGPDALTLVADYEPRLILLDIGLPGMDGLEVCRQVRQWSKVPIILVSAQDAPTTKVTALDAGADDYITKPFHVVELVARIHAVLRRADSVLARSQSTFRVDGLSIDLESRKVTRAGSEIHLTKTEFDLLREFVRNIDRVLTYDHLLCAVWGGGYDDARLLHVHVCNLRRKLEGDPGGPRHVISVPGVGYRFQCAESA